jgi:hypothetical protein
MNMDIDMHPTIEQQRKNYTWMISRFFEVGGFGGFAVVRAVEVQGNAYGVVFEDLGRACVAGHHVAHAIQIVDIADVPRIVKIVVVGDGTVNRGVRTVLLLIVDFGADRIHIAGVVRITHSLHLALLFAHLDQVVLGL